MEADLIKLHVGYGTAKGHNSFAVGAAAAQEAVRDLKKYPLAAVLVFTSVCYSLEELLRGIHEVVGTAPVLGATTAGEVCNGPQQESVVVVALASPYLRVRVGVGQRVSQDWQQAVAQAVSEPELSPFFTLQDSVTWTELTIEGKSPFGILFSPGNTKTADSCSFEILEELKRLSLGRVPFIGGAAADDWRMEANYVLWGRRAYPDSVLVAVFETQLRFGLAMAHGFHPTNQRATVTRVSGHEVLELDGQPAAESYSRLQGTTREALAGKHLTLTTGRPVGVSVGYGEYIIIVASFFTAGGGVRFTQPIPEGAVLTIMDHNPDHLVAAGKDAFQKALLRGHISDPALALVFPCALRSPLLGDKNHEAITDIRTLASELPVVGFYSFGEQGLTDDGVNRHANEEIAILVLGQQLSYGARVALENEQLRLKLEQHTADIKAASKKLLHEIDERQQAEEALRESEERMKLVLEGSQQGFWDWRIDTGEVKRNELWAEMLGYTLQEIENTLQQWKDFIHPDDRAAAVESLQNHLEGRTPVHEAEYRMLTKDKQYKWILDKGRIVKRDPGGCPSRMTGTHTDITTRKELEEQLIKAQKMEAIGILAGGLAHDYNNLLTAIMGYSEIMMMGLRKEDPFYSYLNEIIKATNRGASLTNQLLAFSRKQIMQPRVINLNGVVIDMDRMLRRLIGEDIDLSTFIDQDLGLVKADPGQIEQILMNLAVNARDAMPNGGKLTVETANVYLDEVYARSHVGVTPGPYVMLAVSDNGMGMDAETISRVFEPFFTTKETGKGTGLGLATVFGIVKQSGGHIWPYSESGRGTTFKIYLPRIEESLEEPKPKAAVPTSLEGQETILVVEDDAPLRELITTALRKYGYKVLEAAHGGEALLICERQDAPIHLMVTDVVMPQISGSALAERLKLSHPEMKVLYMSGYTENAIVHHGVLNSNVNFIPKPFKVLVMVQKVREVLDTTSP